jgi:hypothetical protein
MLMIHLTKCLNNLRISNSMKVLLVFLLVSFSACSIGNIEIFNRLPDIEDRKRIVVYYKDFKSVEIPMFEGQAEQIISGGRNLSWVWSSPRRLINVIDLPKESIDIVREILAHSQCERISLDSNSLSSKEKDLLISYNKNEDIKIYIDRTNSLVKITGKSIKDQNIIIEDLFYIDEDVDTGINVSYYIDNK